MSLVPLPTLTPMILVVDDAPEQRSALQGILEEAGCRVVAAASGREGLDCALEERPDLILLDLLMPDMDGKDVLRALRGDSRTAQVPVIFLTVLGGPEDIAAGLDAGANDYILKPFHTRELLARVRSHLEWKRSLDRERALSVELRAALADVRQLSGLIPICAQCKKVRDDHGFWQQVEAYISSHMDARFSHGLCPDCLTACRDEWNRELGGEANSAAEHRPSAPHGHQAAPATWIPPRSPFALEGAAAEGPPRILIVDDDPGSIQTLIQFLRLEHKILVATDGPEALETAARERPDLILLDVVMEGMNGHQVCRALKRDPGTRHIPVMFVTGREQEEDEVTGLELGAVDYIVKPFSLPVVHLRVRTQLELKRYRDLLERQSLLDGLTGLPNRRHLQEALDFIWRQSLRLSQSMAVILMDVDHFKDFNDTHGHPAGDACLQALGRCLGDLRRRSTDVVARFGGEEFICLLPGMDLGMALQLAETLRSAVEDLEIRLGASGETARVTLSLGVAARVPTLEDRPSALIEAADRALYAAKRSGRNRVSSGSDAGPFRVL